MNSIDNEEPLKFFDSWDPKEETPFEIVDDIQERCEELEIIFESYFPKESVDIARVIFLIIRKILLMRDLKQVLIMMIILFTER